jgi:hypothetical protein
MGLKYLSRCSDEIFGHDRWFLTGMSAMFIDPLLSNASSLFVIANHFIVELIKADIAGDAVRHNRLRRHFNVFMRSTYRTLTRELGTRYTRYSSFDTYAAWQTAYDNNYYNYVVSLHLDNYKAYIKAIESHGDDCGCSEEPNLRGGQGADIAIGKLADEYLAFIDARGEKHGRNRGYFIEGTSRLSILENMDKLSYDRKKQMMEAQTSYKACARYYASRMSSLLGKPFEPAAFEQAFDPDWTTGQTLATLMEAMGRIEPGAAKAMEDVRWVPKGPIDMDTTKLLSWYGTFTGPMGNAE